MSGSREAASAGLIVPIILPLEGRESDSETLRLRLTIIFANQKSRIFHSVLLIYNRFHSISSIKFDNLRRF